MSEIRSQATPARDELAGERDAIAMWLAGYGIPDVIAEDAATALLNDYQRKPRTVNSATELADLPKGTIIRDQLRGVCEILGNEIFWIGNDVEENLQCVELPATVLFTPEVAE